MNTRATCTGRHDDPVEADVGALCGKCFSRIRSSLVELPAVAAWLEVNIAAGGTAGERVSGSREEPIPLRLDITDLIGPDSRKPVAAPAPTVLLWEDGLPLGEFPTWRAATEARWAEILDVPDVDVDVHRWRVAVSDKRGCDQQGTESLRAVVDFWAKQLHDDARDAPWPDRNDLAGLVDYLAAHLSWIAGQPWVADLADDVRRAAAAAHRSAPWREEVRRDTSPCSKCRRHTVVLHIGEGESRCERRAGGCGRTQPLSEYVLNALLPGTRKAG